MTATLTYLIHRCTEHTPCGDVLEQTGSTLVRKTFLRVDGKPVFVGTKADALKYATDHGYEVADGD